MYNLYNSTRYSTYELACTQCTASIFLTGAAMVLKKSTVTKELLPIEVNVTLFGLQKSHWPMTLEWEHSTLLVLPLANKILVSTVQ